MIAEAAQLNAEVPGLLLDWYGSHARPMPWSDHFNPWMVAVGVIMLQQTTVTAAVPYLHRFLGSFPTPAALAEASEQQALHAWAGLGYYSRVRNLRKAAQLIVERYNGIIPNNTEAIRALPGFGDYSAGALASIAFGIAVPALDANGFRIFARLIQERGELHQTSTRCRLIEQCQKLIPESQPGLFNQALMDFGAMICTAREPKCAECVLRQHCGCYLNGTVEEIPVLKAPKQSEQVHEVFAVLQSDAGLYVTQRPQGSLLAGFWQFPSVWLEPNEDVLQAAVRAMENEGIQARAREVIAQYRHSVLHYRISGHVVRCECSPEQLQSLPLIPAKQLKHLPLAGAMKKALKLIQVFD